MTLHKEDKTHYSTLLCARVFIVRKSVYMNGDRRKGARRGHYCEGAIVCMSLP